MRVLSILCLVVFAACAGPQRPVCDPDVTRVSSSVADAQGGLIWRFSFEVSKAWAQKAPQEAQKFQLNSVGHDAVLFLQFKPGHDGDTALSIAGDLLAYTMAIIGDPMTSRVEAPGGSEREAWFSFSGKSDGLEMTVQGRIRRVTSGGRSTWMVLIGMSTPAKARLVADDMARAASTAVLEPIEW